MAKLAAGVLGVAVLVAVSLDSASVEACSAPNCRPEFLMLPARIPANTPGFYWEPAHSEVWDPPADQIVDESVVRLVSLAFPDSDGGPGVSIQVSPLDAGAPTGARYANHVVSVQQTLEPNSFYRFERPAYCDDYGAYATAEELDTVIETGPEVPLPTELGRLFAAEPRATTVLAAYADNPNAACSGYPDAVVVDLELEFTDEVTPWRELLLYWSVVDGVAVHHYESLNDAWERPPSPAPDGKDYLWVPCPTDTSWAAPLGSVEPGVHSVQMMAWLPGTNEVISSETIEIELRCAEEPVVDPDASVPVTLDAGTPEPEPQPEPQPEPDPVDASTSVSAPDSATAEELDEFEAPDASTPEPEDSMPPTDAAVRNEPVRNEPVRNEPVRNEPALGPVDASPGAEEQDDSVVPEADGSAVSSPSPAADDDGGAPSGPRPDNDSPRDQSGGCHCRVTHRSPAVGWWALAVLGMGLLRLRGRARSTREVSPCQGGRFSEGGGS
jgi:hypothetical protein